MSATTRNYLVTVHRYFTTEWPILDAPLMYTVVYTYALMNGRTPAGNLFELTNHNGAKYILRKGTGFRETTR